MKPSKHWLFQRLSALALLPIIPTIWWLSRLLVTSSYPQLRETLNNKILLLILTLFFLVLIFHIRAGLEVIIDDYTKNIKRKICLSLLNIILLALLAIFFSAILLIVKGTLS